MLPLLVSSASYCIYCVAYLSFYSLCNHHQQNSLLLSFLCRLCTLLESFCGGRALRPRFPHGLSATSLDSLPLCVNVCVKSWFRHNHLQFHALRLLLILELGSRAVLALVSFFFIPFIRAQKDFFLLAADFVLGLGAGGFKFPPLALL